MLEKFQMSIQTVSQIKINLNLISDSINHMDLTVFGSPIYFEYIENNNVLIINYECSGFYENLSTKMENIITLNTFLGDASKFGININQGSSIIFELERAVTFTGI